MREDLKKLKYLRDTLIGLSMEIDILEKEISIINTDIHYMVIAKNALNENLKILKREKVIAMVNQYKKSIDELEVISNKIEVYRNHQKKNNKKLEKATKQYGIYSLDYDFQKQIVENQKIVLYFDPSRKKAKNEE